MSTEIESPVGNFCCTCMIRDNEADTEFQSIFDAIPNTDKRISDLIKILIECNIVKGMSNRMCGKCVQRISDVYEFQQMYLRTKSKYRQLTEDKKYIVCEEVVSTDQIPDPTVEVSDPLKEDDCTSEDNVEADGKENPYHDLRRESSLSSDDDFNWPSEEEKSVTESKEVPTNPKTFECEICHAKFNKASKLSYHRCKYHPVNAFVCNICGKGYKTEGKFQTHELKHKYDGKEQNREKEDNREEHPDEHSVTSLMQSKKGSKRKRNRKPEKPKTCEICHKVFSRSGNLKIHKLTHTREKNFLCKECGKSFACQSALSEHERRHSGVKPYECPLCPKKFSTASNLFNHKVIHSDEKPYICDLCGASFKFAAVLRKHKLCHGEKSVKCEQCDMRFYMVGPMRRHMLIHTGEKPDKCKYCDRAFNQRGCLMQHMKVHLGNNVYRCELCPKGFPTFKEMQTHYASHKNEDEATRKKNAEALADYERRIMERESSTHNFTE